MTLGRQFNIVKVEHSKSERKGTERKGRLLSKLKMHDFFSTRKITNFHTAEEFFENHHNSFMPMNTINLAPKSERPLAPTKFRIHKMNQQTETDFNNFLHSNKFKKNMIREAFHLYCQDNLSPSILQANSMSPSPRRNHRDV